MHSLRDLFTGVDHARYLAWRARKSSRPAAFSLRDGQRLLLRPPPATDTTTAFEIFVAEVYRSVGPARDASFTRIVDVGANVGFSLLYWAKHYPSAELIAFEPHPVHVDSIRENLKINGLSSRVKLHAAAASTRPGVLSLTDEEHCSTTLARAGAKSFQVEAIDFFDAVGDEPIDLLKLDIEGGEYQLLADARFAALPVRTCVLEWHKTPEHPDGRAWCEERLRSAGFVVRQGLWSSEVNGLLWGFRDTRPSGAVV
jgi:FkbM family methyltransferase